MQLSITNEKIACDITEAHSHDVAGTTLRYFSPKWQITLAAGDDNFSRAEAADVNGAAYPPAHQPPRGRTLLHYKTPTPSTSASHKRSSPGGRLVTASVYSSTSEE